MNSISHGSKNLRIMGRVLSVWSLSFLETSQSSPLAIGLILPLYQKCVAILFIFSSIFEILIIFHYSDFDGYVVLSNCSFNLHFSKTNDIKHFCIPIFYFSYSFVKDLFKFFSIYL
jgi:hypothetical protein